jgi:hypothetical protein
MKLWINKKTAHFLPGAKLTTSAEATCFIKFPLINASRCAIIRNAAEPNNEIRHNNHFIIDITPLHAAATLSNYVHFMEPVT